MKNSIIAAVFLAVSSCSIDNIDMNEAIKTAENAIHLISEKKFEELSKLYTKDFADGETKETREKKFAEIMDATGGLVEFHLSDSLREDNIVLKFIVKHSRVTTTETYTIAREDGKYLLAGIYITNK